MAEVLDLVLYPNGTEQFVITKGNGQTRLYFYKGELTFDAGFFVSSQSGIYTAVWNDVSRKWEQEQKESFQKINVDYDEWKELLYSSEALDMVGMQSGPTEILTQGREEIEGFTHNEMLDFSYLNTEEGGFFVINNGDYLFKVTLDINQLEIIDNDGPLKIKSLQNFYYVGVFKGGEYIGDPRVQVSFESFHPYNFIVGGSKEVVFGEVLLVPKLQFMDSKDLLI